MDRGAEIVLVDGLDLRVLMGFCGGAGSRRPCTGGHALPRTALVGADGLSAAADTAAGAGHDLNE